MTIEDSLENKGSAEEPILVQCCVCKEYRTNGQDFKQVPEALDIMYQQYFSISHTYCTGCADRRKP